MIRLLDKFMPTALTQFQIEGLHGRTRIIDIPIRDNRLVLVGENGTGKSTVANLLYYVLTQQWRRVNEYRFSSIRVQSSEGSVQITHEDIEALVAFQTRHVHQDIRHKYPPSIIREVSKYLAQESLFIDPEEEDLVERIADIARTSR